MRSEGKEEFRQLPGSQIYVQFGPKPSDQFR